jgi:hypothetical protein
MQKKRSSVKAARLSTSGSRNDLPDADTPKARLQSGMLAKKLLAFADHAAMKFHFCNGSLSVRLYGHVSPIGL